MGIWPFPLQTKFDHYWAVSHLYGNFYCRVCGTAFDPELPVIDDDPRGEENLATAAIEAGWYVRVEDPLTSYRFVVECPRCAQGRTEACLA